MSTKELKQAFTAKMILAKLIIKTGKGLLENDQAVQVEDFSQWYKLYHVNEKDFKPSKLVTDATGTLPNFRVLKHNINSLDEVKDLINEYKNMSEFYGVLIVRDKKPYNVLSKNFIEGLKGKFEFAEGDTLYVYLLKNAQPINPKVIKETVQYLDNIKVQSIMFAKEEDTQKKPLFLSLKTPPQVEEGGIHLSDYHLQIPFTDGTTVNSLMAYDYNFLLNAELTTEESSKLPPTWTIEMGIVQRGTILPCYGLFRKRADGKVEELIGATKHPNVSSDGLDYCTGSNLKNTVTGISQLHYANLDSPLTTTIWRDESLSIAKGFIHYYLFKLNQL